MTTASAFALALAITTWTSLPSSVSAECSWCTPPEIETCGVSDSADWTLARAIGVAKGSSWFRTTDHLQGTAAAFDYAATEEYNVVFEEAVAGWNQLLFVTGDCSTWLIASKFAVNGETYSNQDRWICASSEQTTPYQAMWYNRGLSEDPWVSTVDHATAVSAGKIVYGENNYGSTHAATVIVPKQGVYVYIRNNGQLDDTGCVGCLDEDCDDENVCNGVEYCDESGQCVSPNDFEDCGVFFTCDSTMGCVRDCDTFAIDGYLQDCSAEFDTIKNEGADLLEAVEGANTDIAALQADLAAMQEEVTAALATVGDRLSALETFIDAFGPNNANDEVSDNQFNSPSEQQSAAGGVSAFMKNDDALNHTVVNSQWVQVAVVVVVLLLALNVVLLAKNCCAQKQAHGKGKYRGVVQKYSSDEERAQFK